MIKISDLSSVGLGTYRMEGKTPEHQKALLHAINLGCNLIDTASYYMYGLSELMIGQVLKDHPDLSSKVFIITKAGYLEIFEGMPSYQSVEDAVGKDMVEIHDYRKHCIHPAFLEREIKQSLQRLNRNYLDCFLLHNPEYYFDDKSAPPNSTIYYQRIKKAFRYCESLVAQNIIRYYGISSNTLALPRTQENVTDLEKLLAIANEISPDHHFKFIQFPFNFLEQGALEKQYGGKSMLELAKENGIITIANRPLSSQDENGFVRFAAYAKVEVKEEEVLADQELLMDLIESLDTKVEEKDPESEAMDFPLVQFLIKHFNEMGNHEAVDEFYRKLREELLDPLYDYDIPQNIKQKIETIKNRSKIYSRIKMTRRAHEVKKSLIEKKEIASSDTRPMPAIACENYLNKGIDHVLVGSRKRDYVDQLQGFYQSHHPVKP